MSPARIKHYQSLGWTFEHEKDRNHHNGDWEDDYYLKSPRLRERVSVYDRYNDTLNRMEAPSIWMTEEEIVVKETEAYCRERLAKWGNEIAVERTVLAALVKDPDATSITVTISLQ